MEAVGLKDAKKQPPTSDPFVHYFEYGADLEGYWNYQHMVLQVEDFCDAITNLYPQYDFLFLVDHSSGHDKQREDGLNVTSCLGPYVRIFSPGDVQSLVFNQQMTDLSG
jgi:hypothetical protein